MEVSKFQFANPRLVKMVFNLNDGFEAEEDDSGILQNLPLQIEVGIGAKQETSAIVRLTANVGKENLEFPFYLSAAMCAEFRWEKDLPQEQVDILLKENAPALLMGYLRPYVASITEASPIQTVHLPFLDFSRSETK